MANGWRTLDAGTKRLMLALMSLSLAGAAWIAMSELNRLISDIAYGSTTYAASSFYGPARLFELGKLTQATKGHVEPWVAASLADTASISSTALLLLLHLLFDVLFIGAYVWFLMLLVHRENRPWLMACIWALVVLDQSENVLAAFAFFDLDHPWGVLLASVHVVTALKWVAFLGLAIQLMWLVKDRWNVLGLFVRRVGIALKFQRFSLAVLILLSLLMASTNGEVQEQLPDVQRTLLDGWEGLAHGVLAGVTLIVLTIQLLYLGRLRTDRFEQRTRNTADDRRDPRPFAWYVLFGVAVLVVALDSTFGAFHITYKRFLVAMVILLVVMVVSAVLRLFHRRRRLEIAMPELPVRRGEDLPAVRRTGDAVAGGVVAVVGIGLIRSFVAPAVLTSQDRVWSIGLTLLGFGFAVAVWPFLWITLRSVVRRASERDADGVASSRGERLSMPAAKVIGGMAKVATELPLGQPQSRVTKIVGVVGLAIGGASYAWLLFFPLTASRFFGVSASLMIALGSLTALLTLVTVMMQRTKPREVFRLLRFRVTPVLTMAVVIAVVAGTLDSPDRHHTLRTLRNASIDDRPTLERALGDWTAARSAEVSCLAEVQGAGQLKATPLVLVAAAGGGIRAAWWTASAIDELTDGECGGQAVFLSSGVSGGSLGLVVADAVSDPGDTVDELTGPDALAAGASSMLTGDLLHAFTGLSIGPFGLPAGESAVPGDRAALMEMTWEAGVPALKDQFAGGTSGEGLAGQLILNSTSVTTGCRVFVSTIQVTSSGRGAGTAADGPTAPTCGGKDTGSTAGSYDLLNAYFASGCLDALRASTAAMISARFPYVTPTGVTSQCDGLAAEQLVDGGYAEGSGLGTLIDIAPRLMEAVRSHNAKVMSGVNDNMLVVPFVVFLENHFRLDLPRKPPGTELETLAPLKTRGAAAQLVSSNVLLQRAGAAIRDWVDCPIGVAVTDESESSDQTTLALSKAVEQCNAAEIWVDDQWKDRIVVVAPETQPRVEAPLGWVLSKMSKQSLRTALSNSAESCGEREKNRACPPGIWRLDDLKQALAGKPE